MDIDLSSVPTRAPKDLDKDKTKEQLASILKELDELQNILYADGSRSLLVVLQGMDASGKDGLINNVFTFINPQGISVTSFKAPDQKELAHDFLWRIHANVPAKGMIKIFNRSHYEDVLITRVHKWVDDKLAEKRMKAINDFEELLQNHNSTTILKFYLHISKEEQQKRLLERTQNPTKMWKHNANDEKEAELWPEYIKAYEDCFKHCNNVPWVIVPSDQNWYKEYLVANEILKTLREFNLQYPVKS